VRFFLVTQFRQRDDSLTLTKPIHISGVIAARSISTRVCRSKRGCYLRQMTLEKRTQFVFGHISRLDQDELPRTAQNQMGIEEVRIFRNDDTLLVDRDLIKDGILCGVFRRKIQRVVCIVAVSHQRPQRLGGKCASTRNFM
jgi:hypothetical protein